MDDLLDALARLTARLESLERRLSALEQVSSPSVTNALPPASPTVESSTGAFSLTQAPGMLPVAGKAMLGIAGAYLLRAVAESGSVPKLIVVALALSYASLWLIWAARVAPGSGFAGAAYSGTAVLILVPMLWELTLSFRVLSPWDTSAVLCGVTVLVAVLAWKHNLALLVWVTNLTAVAMVLALMIATRDLMPFVAALLWMACVAEFAACRNRWSSLRPLVAIVADLATLVAIYVLTSPESVRSENVAVRS